MRKFIIAVGLTMVVIAVGTFLRPAAERDRVGFRE